MEIMEAIYQRRSIRKFSGEPVSRETLKDITAAGMMAPSAGNQQPWHFVTITDAEKLKSAAEVNPNARMAAGAPAGILVCGDTELEKYPGYWVQDCSAAMQNMLLAIHGMGLGAVWTGIWTNEERVLGFRKLFGLPQTVNPLGLVVIGHLPEGAQEGNARDRFLAGRVHHDFW